MPNRAVSNNNAHLSEAEKAEKKKAIEALRVQARKMTAENDDLVEKINKLDPIMTEDLPVEEQLRASEVRQTLMNTWTKNYKTQLPQLFKVINREETSLYGSSDVGGSRPFAL